MKTGILLSACMMVKNEEKNLERCLKSIKKLVDEIVVVDTGSTDETVQIAKRFGARVYHHEWAKNFSLHRNQSIDYARGKWVMIIDADEEFVMDNGMNVGNVRSFLTHLDQRFPCGGITVKDFQKGHNVLQFCSTRFFRRGLVRYEGIVHNQPILKNGGQACLLTGAYVHHYGYDLTPEQKEAKFKRSSELLLKQVADGEMTDCLPYFFLGQLYADHGQPKESAEWAEKYWESRDKIPKDHFCDSVFFTTTKQYMKIGDREKAHEWLMRGIEALPGNLDMAIAALEYGVWIGDKDLQISASRDFISLYEKYQKDPALKGNSFVYALRPEALAYAYFHLAVCELTEGSQALMTLIGVLNTLPAPFRVGMMGELQAALAKSALPIHFQAEVTPPAPPASEGFVMSNIH